MSHSDADNSIDTLMGFVFGLIFGGAIALLLAPKSGTELQDDLKRELPRQVDRTKNDITARLEERERRQKAAKLASAKRKEYDSSSEQFGI